MKEFRKSVLIISMAITSVIAFASSAPDYVKLYKKSLPSTVVIIDIQKNKKLYQYKEKVKNLQGYNHTGSGFILSADGYIVTNAHVVNNTYSGSVILANGQTKPYILIGEDLNRDIALIKIDTTDLKPAKLGNSDTLNSGEQVYSIGNPELSSFAFTNGTIASPQVACSFVLPKDSSDYCLRVNMPIYPGNSGGPVFNTDGEVIGINTSIDEDLNYKTLIDFGSGNAIPINTVMQIVNELKQYGHFTAGSLGLTLQPISTLYESMLGIPDQNIITGELDPSGALVSSIKPGSQAEKDGFQNEDYLLKVNQHVIRSTEWLNQYIYLIGPNKKLQFEIIRNKKLLNLTTSTELAPGNDESQQIRYFPNLGIALQSIKLAPSHDYGYTGGLKLVSEDSYFHDSLGLEAEKTIIVEVDHHKVTTLEEMAQIQKDLKDGQVILIKSITTINGNRVPYYTPFEINL